MKDSKKETMQLTNEELSFIKEGSASFTKIKISLGELELQKQGLLEDAKNIIKAFNNNEKILIEKYGADAVINMQTGEVSQKEKTDDIK